MNKSSIAVALFAIVFSLAARAENVTPPIGSPKFLTLPFDDAAVELRQGWFYDLPATPLTCPREDLYPQGSPTHCAIDYIKGLVNARQTFEIIAAAPGCASRIDSTGAAGTFVFIRHDAVAPNGSPFYTRYLHLDPTRVSSRIAVAPQCTRVDRGQAIGWAGNSGIPNEAVHLHFDVVVGGVGTGELISNRVDPYDIAAGVLSRGLVPTADRYPPNDSAARCGDNHLWINCPGTAGPGDENADAVLMIDSSGSMLWNDPLNKRLEAARAFLVAAIRNDQVAVVDFDGLSRLASPLLPVPSGIQSLRDAIGTIDASGGTNIGLGVQAGCDALLASSSGHSVSFGILLTDGYGAFAGQDECFRDRNWPIYTFGIGDADNLLLLQIANRTGGEFASLPTSNLICEFQAVRARVAGLPVAPCSPVNILPYQSILFSRIVPRGQSTATFTSSWVGSDVEMTLTTPSGRSISRYALGSDVQHDHGAAFEAFTVDSPEPGEWQVELYGADIPPGGEAVVFGFTSIRKKVTPVLIDIHPGSWPNAVNPRSRGVIPVVVFGTADFNVRSISSTKTVFGRGSARPVHDVGHIEDVNGDGYLDLLLHFATQESRIQCGDMSALLSAETVSGDAVEGTDAVTTVSCRGR